MKNAISLQLRYGDPTTAHRVLRAVTLGCRTPTIFRPVVAQFIYRYFCKPGMRVWDPCSGFGGRLLGAYGAGVHYTGTDVDEKTVTGNRALAERLGAKYDIVASPAENFDPPPVDLVFTSPPYFDRERYSENEKQTWKKYGSFESWLEGFLRPVTQRAHGALQSGSHLVLNVADLRERDKTIPIVSRTIAVAIESGFAHSKTLLMPIASVNRTLSSEPVLVFRRL